MTADAAPGEKPKGIKTHLRNMLIVPEMIGSIVGIYNGETRNSGSVAVAIFGGYLMLGIHGYILSWR